MRDGSAHDPQKFCWQLATPLGALLLVGDARALHGLYFSTSRSYVALALARALPRSQAPFRRALDQLQEYFDGRRRRFDLLLAPQGTAFQQRVWRAVRQIPFGAVSTYGEIARSMGCPNAARAVGRANGANPWPIVIPCHRVIGSDRRLVGYGSGLHLKRALLKIEGLATSDTALLTPVHSDIVPGTT